MNKPFVFTIPVSFCNKNIDMIDGKEQIVYYVRTKAKELPEEIWFKTNPRKQNLTSKIAKKIKTSLLDANNNKFHLMNRGILISAGSVELNLEDGKQTATVTLTDRKYHGNIDGGHTYKLILENKEELADNKEVMLEIMTGVEGFYEELAAARNTSVQVKDVSIAELGGKFDLVKNAIEDEDYAERIAYKENEDKTEKDIPIQSLLGLLSLFDIEKNKNNTHPTKVYSSIASVLNYYLKHVEDEDNIFVKQEHIIKDIVELYNQIELELDASQPIKSRPVKNTLFLKHNGMTAKTQTTKDLKNNDVKYVIVPDGKETLFMRNKITYKYGNAAIYPMLAALRVCLKENEETNKLEWEVDPKEVLTACIDTFIEEYADALKKTSYSPEVIYKQTNLWSSLYDKAMIKKLMIQAENNQLVK